MTDIITIFKSEELSPKTRARIIIKLGEAINYKYGSNMTEPLVFELLQILDPTNEIFENETFVARAKK